MLFSFWTLPPLNSGGGVLGADVSVYSKFLFMTLLGVVDLLESVSSLSAFLLRPSGVLVLSATAFLEVDLG